MARVHSGAMQETNRAHDITTSGRQQTLLLDADDTLWENNIYFERAIAAFISSLDHTLHTPEQVRVHLNAVERRTIAVRGYGTDSFRISLAQCFEELSQAPPTREQHEQIMHFVDAIVRAEIEVMPGVPQALTELAQRHRLILVTKGNEIEQRDKLARSGLATYFHAGGEDCRCLSTGGTTERL